MLSGVSSRKARGRADRFMSWKPLVQWPKANRAVIWSNTCLVTSSYQSERADSDIEHLCPLWWKLFPAAPVRCWEAKAAQGTSCFDLGSAPAAPVAAQLQSWFLLGLSVPGNVVGWAGVAEPSFLAMRWDIAGAQLGFRVPSWICGGLGLGGGGVIFSCTNWVVKLEVKIYKIEEEILYFVCFQFLDEAFL